MVQKTLLFIQRDIWRFAGRTLHGRRGFFLRMLRIMVLSFREFQTDKCSLRASALTFYSLLSIVPVFAMAFGIAKGFNVDQILREKVLENMKGQQEIVTRVIEFSENLLQNTQGGVIAGAGLLLLFWTVIQVLSNIEISFNDIWGIKKHRALGQKFTDYLALMMIAPIFFILASSATVFIASQVQLITERFQFLGIGGPVILTALKILPFTVFAGLLTHLYIFMPNGKIQFKSALLGGFVAGAIYQLVQWAYIHFQIGAAKAGAVYGTFAALPLFLAWLQISWLIVLYGAELAFAHQNEDRFEFEDDCFTAREEFKKLLALRVMHLCLSRFSEGLPPQTAHEISDELEMPMRMTHELVDRLLRAHLLSPVEGENEREKKYQPGRDPGDITVKFVIDQLEKTGTQDIPVKETPELQRLRECMAAFGEAVEHLPENVLLKDLLPKRAPAALLTASKRASLSS
jgi:membrane protein